MASVREMLAKDVDEVARIEQQSFSRPWSRQAFLDALALGNTYFLVAEENGKILGYAGMYVAIDEGEVTNVAVRSQERCRGIGGMLLDALKKEAERRALARLVLEVRVSNEGAIRLYERKGFQNRGIRRQFYDCPKEDAYILIYGQ